MTEKDKNKYNKNYIFIEEYKTLSLRADNFTRLIWSLSTIFFTLSASGIYLVYTIKVNDIKEYYCTIIISFLFIFLWEWWAKVSNRWNSYIFNWYWRMEEIEKSLGMYGNRAIKDFDNYLNNNNNYFRYHLNISKEFIKKKKTNISYSTKSVKSLRNTLKDVLQYLWIFFIILKVGQFYFDKNIKNQVISNSRFLKYLSGFIKLDNDYIYLIIIIVLPLLILMIFYFYLKKRIS